MATLRDVADLVGVHPSTVSRALDPRSASLVSEATRDRVRKAADELGFQVDTVASGLRRGRTQTIGVVVPDLSNPYAAPMIRGIENSLDSRNYMALITETQDDQSRARRVFDALLGRRVDAVITLASRSGDEALLRRVAKRVPVVLAIRDLTGSGLPGVVGDEERGGRIAADHLIDMGHTRVAQLHGPLDVTSFVHRGAGFSSRVAERGATLVDFTTTARAPTIEEGRTCMAQLLAHPGERPTAVFAHNDLMAVGAIEAITDAGLNCPQDISVLGYNDAPLTGYTDPPLSTIALPGYELGRFAAEMALSFVEDPTREAHVLSLPPRLVPRASVRRIEP